LAFVLVAGNAESFQRGQQIVRNQASSWIVGNPEVTARSGSPEIMDLL